MTKKQPLKPGDRVRVYGSAHNFYPPHQQFTDYNGRKGTLVLVTPNVIHFRPDGYDDTYHAVAHPRQCVRLKPRAPKQEERERVVRWVNADHRGNTTGLCFVSAMEAMQRHTLDDGANPVRLVECSESEVVVSRESLAKAWDKARIGLPGEFSTALKQFCEALGLGLGKDAG